MKKLRLILILMLPLFLFSCKKDTGPYIQIKNIDNLIYEAIRDFSVDVESDTEGNLYITVMLAKADS